MSVVQLEDTGVVRKAVRAMDEWVGTRAEQIMRAGNPKDASFYTAQREYSTVLLVKLYVPEARNARGVTVTEHR